MYGDAWITSHRARWWWIFNDLVQDMALVSSGLQMRVTAARLMPSGGANCEYFEQNYWGNDENQQ